MKIYLLDINKNMTDAWQEYFDTFEEIEIVNEDFTTFMNKHQNIEAIVSPANSFGLMDGGYDKAITDYFGEELMKDVQNTIMIKWYGEQPVGTSMTVPIRNRIISDKKRGLIAKKYAVLIHTPSMRTPEIITDYRIIYQCMRTTLIEAIKQTVDSVVIPAFGGATGNVPYDVIAKMMFLAYKQLCNKPNEINWNYALGIANELM